MILACYTLWFALHLMIPDECCIVDPPLHNFTIAAIILLFVQLTYGAFMAGLHAAISAPTWPTINTMWIPENLAYRSYVSDKINVQFIHRSLAYLLLIVIVGWYYRATIAAKFNTESLLGKTRVWPLYLVAGQVLLGIITVISAPLIVHGRFGVFETLAELHQLVAMFLLMGLVINLYIVKKWAN
jgi:cytochrome c oxidase assembly protein subunit 15